MLDPVELAMNRMLAICDNATFHEKMAQYWSPILQRFTRAVEAAKPSGQIRPEVDSRMVIDMIISPILSSTVFTRTPMEAGYIEALVRQVLMGMLAPSEGAQRASALRSDGLARSI